MVDIQSYLYTSGAFDVTGKSTDRYHLMVAGGGGGGNHRGGKNVLRTCYRSCDHVNIFVTITVGAEEMVLLK